MAKNSGGTKSSGAASPIISVEQKRAISEKNIKAAKMPANYNNTYVEVNGKEYSIRRVPTGFGKQQLRNGRFTVTEVGNSSNYRDFSFGDSYAGYTSPKEAFSDVKNYLRKMMD